MKNQFSTEYEERKHLAIDIYKKGNISLVKLSKLLNHDRETITRWIKQEGLPIAPPCNKFSIKSDIFNIIDTEEKAYWLGFLYADGYVNDKYGVELTLKCSDEEHLLKFKRFLGFQGKIYKDSYRVRLCFSDKKIATELKKMGCTERKSLTLRFPNNINNKLKHHFIRGYFDGDGSINDPKKNAIGISLLGTYEFLSYILKYFTLENPIKIKDAKKNINGVKFFSLTGKNARFFLSSIYRDSSLFLKRKYERFEEHLCNCNKVKRGRKCMS